MISTTNSNYHLNHQLLRQLKKLNCQFINAGWKKYGYPTFYNCTSKSQKSKNTADRHVQKGTNKHTQTHLKLFMFSRRRSRLHTKVVQLLHSRPVDKLPPISDELRPVILVLQVVGVLPNIKHQQRIRPLW